MGDVRGVPVQSIAAGYRGRGIPQYPPFEPFSFVLLIGPIRREYREA